jgi:thiol-disulfide isomerase/thioredoxin
MTPTPPHPRPTPTLRHWALVCLGCVWLLGGHSAAASTGSTELLQAMGSVRVGEVIPTFAGFTPDGDTVRSKELLKPRSGAAPTAVVVSFFGTWCAPCKDGLPIINEVMRANPSATAVLIALPPQLNRVPTFLRSIRVDLPVINDTHHRITERLGLSVAKGGFSEGLPRTIVVSQAGVVQAIFGKEGTDFKTVLTQALDRAASQTTEMTHQ